MVDIIAVGLEVPGVHSGPARGRVRACRDNGAASRKTAPEVELRPRLRWRERDRARRRADQLGVVIDFVDPRVRLFHGPRRFINVRELVAVGEMRRVALFPRNGMRTSATNHIKNNGCSAYSVRGRRASSRSLPSTAFSASATSVVLRVRGVNAWTRVMSRPGAEGTGIKTAVRVEAKFQTQRVDLITLSCRPGI